MNDLTPKAAGFSMPAEWAPHSACWMAWPSRQETWQLIDLPRAERAYAAVAQAVAKFEPVKILANPEQVEHARHLCGSNIEIIPLPINDSWTRDTGPTFLMNKTGELAGVDWQHNAWGNTYEDYALDQKIARFVIERAGARYFQAPFVLEGGSICSDGEGTILTTRECLLNPNRNPSLSEAQIQRNLLDYLGADKVLWLNRGLCDDQTNGHVDEIACFIAPGKVLCLITEDEEDPNYEILQENLEILESATDANGRQLEVHTIEQPAAVYMDDWRLTLSYMNFYMANGGIVMPAFDQTQADNAAFATIKRLFPNRTVIQIPALDIFAGGGGIHCITQQQPLCR